MRLEVRLDPFRWGRGGEYAALPVPATRAPGALDLLLVLQPLGDDLETEPAPQAAAPASRTAAVECHPSMVRRIPSTLLPATNVKKPNARIASVRSVRISPRNRTSRHPVSASRTT